MVAPRTQGPRPDRDVQEVADAIRRYLDRMPEAADSLRGIVRWWLQNQRYNDARAIVEAALGLLVQQGVVQTETSGQGETIYYRSTELPAVGELEASDG